MNSVNNGHLIFIGESSSFLSFKKGDLIVLETDTGETVLNSGWCYGLCESTGKKGDFPAECVYVLPTIVKPAPETLVNNNNNNNNNSNNNNNNNNNIIIIIIITIIIIIIIIIVIIVLVINTLSP